MSKRITWTTSCVAVVLLTSCVIRGAIAQPIVPERPGQSEYTDKNSHFRFRPPQGWKIKEFDDPRTKVEFYVPVVGAGNMRDASLFFLSQDIKAAYPSGEFDIFKESENRVSRLKSSGAKDARFTKIEFCGIDASLIEATLAKNQMQMYGLMFLKHERIYTISFTTTPLVYDKYFPIIKVSLDTFQCTAPEGGVQEEVSQEDIDTILSERIRVQINALNDPDMGDDAEASLRAYGDAAVPALLDIEKFGTAIQRTRAKRILGKTSDSLVIAEIAQLRYGLVAEGELVLVTYYENDPEKADVPKKEDGTYVLPKDTQNGSRYTLYQGLKNPDGTIKVMEKITHPRDKGKVKTFLVTDVGKKFITGKTEFVLQDK
ncbi:MAG: hypothetical protein V1922_01750 [bacterium]